MPSELDEFVDLTSLVHLETVISEVPMPVANEIELLQTKVVKLVQSLECAPGTPSKSLITSLIILSSLGYPISLFALLQPHPLF